MFQQWRSFAPSRGHEMGDREKALEHLQKALDRWKDADPVYKPASEARATLADWTS